MRNIYIQTVGGSDRVNIDVYEPQLVGAQSGKGGKPAIVVVCGGGGKDPRTGSPRVGKHAAGYHDLGEALSQAGFWAIIPSRRGDPQRTPELRANLAEGFRLRLPEELFQDKGPNGGLHSHYRHVAEVTWLVQNLHSIFGSELDIRRVGFVGNSAGGGVALAAAAELGDRIASLALWGSALKTSQWFAGPRSDFYFNQVLDRCAIRYAKEMFLHEMCDAISFVDKVALPALFACAVPDPYAIPEPPDPDPWTNLDEQIELLRYAIRCRYSKVVGIKGAEHTMYSEQPLWKVYISMLLQWFNETL